ncbi:putative membrane protein [Enterobacter sp. BIGb0383]|uniref:DUF2339 domain-containing protein n=1 Tax=unclassified Enterobacter TaxID=2608935 RepID=UPI000F49DACA|nr:MULTISPECIES: DUF2339 domain-containing protein [unclassified Enterobacter]ROP50006.1 putative membrane protein [Enterobacter sp. BIGb0383]ROS06252.1 putative membrane protein [Enterobacter sp. BIGb0359]
MDGLLFLGAAILILVLVVVPMVAFSARRRSIAVQDELQQLKQRLAVLEQRSVEPEAIARPAPLAPEVEPLSVEASEPVDVPPPPRNVWARSATTVSSTPSPVAQAKPPESASWGIVTSLVRWFMQGNPLAKLGIVLLFIGLSFLLRYTAEYALFPLELRLVSVALAAMVLLGLGWRLRHKQTVFALILQGGAVGALYLTVFGAFRLWQMLPMTLAFALLIVICAASVGLAVLQRALSLALLASLGGYLAPILLSTGGGSHTALFSFYLLLSIGILAISVWQHWRELNLLGMLFSFGVAGMWGLQNYRPEYYLSCQLFLIANILLFGVLSVGLSLRAQHQRERIIDGVMLFAPPLVGFGMQYAIVQHWVYGPAFSALGFGLVYITLAWGVLKRYPGAGKPLVLAGLALGGAFVTLAIPLALSARWTAMAWALEGLGILWLGMQQQQRRMSYSGTALLILALFSAMWAGVDGLTSLSALLICTVLSGCWMAAALLWRPVQNLVGRLLLVGAILLWMIALGAAAKLMLSAVDDIGVGFLVLLSGSVWLWRALSQRLAWRDLGYAQWLLWPAMLSLVGWQLGEQGHILAAGWYNLVWCLALPSALILLYRDAGAAPSILSKSLHISLFWILLLAALGELWWLVDTFEWGWLAWRFGLPMAAGGVVITLVLAAIRRDNWPFRTWPVLYGTLGLLPLAIPLFIALIVANLLDGTVFGMPYLPLINPLEEGALFAFFGLWGYCRFVETHFAPWTPRGWRLWLFVVPGFWWLNGALLRALADYGEVAWEVESLWASRLVQTSFALFWMLIALVVMVMATRRHMRREWLGGSVLLGIVLVKLMLVDSAGGGGLSRAIAFIGVAVLVLIVGYFAPLPPKPAQEQSKGEEP